MTKQNKYSTTPRDYNHVGPVPLSIATGKALGKVDPTSQTLARDIRNFAWAEDTQESIARFIEWCSILYNFTTDRNDYIDFSVNQMNTQFSDVLKELSKDKDYHSLPEISAARGGHETLGARLDETTTQLAQKPSKGEIAQSDLDKNTFGLDSTWFGADFIQELNNGTIEVTNVEDDSLTTSKYINRSVTYPKLGGTSRANIENQSKIVTGETLELEWVINRYITSSLHQNGEGKVSTGGGHYLSEPFFVPKNTILEFFASQTDVALVLSEWSAEGVFLNPIVNGNKIGTKYYYKATHDMYLRLSHAESYSPFSTVYIKTLNSDIEKINTILEGSELGLNYINAFVSSVNYTGGEGLVIDSPNYRLSETFFVPKGTKINVRASGTLNILTLSEWDGLGGFVAPIFVGDNAIKEQEYIADKDIYLRICNGIVQYPEDMMGVEFYGKLHDVGGGEAYDQSLNTMDDVEFNSLKTNGVIPIGTLSNPPAGLLTGDMWIDTSDSSTNPIVRVKL